jgi:hypothetical protein
MFFKSLAKLFSSPNKLEHGHIFNHDISHRRLQIFYIVPRVVQSAFHVAEWNGFIYELLLIIHKHVRSQYA